MLELRQSCENCQKPIPNDTDEAMICTYECTFCASCVEDVLKNVCPNCGGGFEKRPTRPSAQLTKYPMRSDKVHKPVQNDSFEKMLAKFKDIPPRKR